MKPPVFSVAAAKLLKSFLPTTNEMHFDNPFRFFYDNNAFGNHSGARPPSYLKFSTGGKQTTKPGLESGVKINGRIRSLSSAPHIS